MTSILLKGIILAVAATSATCTIGGISFMDPLELNNSNIPGSDPCNPLYWYPRHIPDYCYKAPTPSPVTPLAPVPLPVPVAMPVPVPLPVPLPYPPFRRAFDLMPPAPLPIPVPNIQAPMPPLVPPPVPILPHLPPPIPPVPIPFGLPLAPTNPMLPVAGVPYPPPLPPPIPPPYPMPPYPMPSYPYPQAGMVPGIPGIVSPDGGINILPFSDAYSDMLEKHKSKMLRKRMQRLLKDYENFPRRRFRKRDKYRRKKVYIE